MSNFVGHSLPEIRNNRKVITMWGEPDPEEIKRAKARLKEEQLYKEYRMSQFVDFELKSREGVDFDFRTSLEEFVTMLIENPNRTACLRRVGSEDPRFEDLGADWDTDEPKYSDVTNLRNRLAKAAEGLGVKLTIGAYPKDTNKHPADMNIIYAKYTGVKA